MYTIEALNNDAEKTLFKEINKAYWTQVYSSPPTVLDCGPIFYLQQTPFIRSVS